MYYAVKIIDGLLHEQSSPDGPWRPMSAEQITQRYAERDREARDLQDRLDRTIEALARRAALPNS